MNKHKILLCLWLATATLYASAQTNGSNSPYSRFGLGNLADRSQGFNKGMGGVALGFREGSCLNLQNPASYSAIDSLSFILDVGIRVETRIERYPIVKDYYDPKFYFPEKVRTFCTNSGNAHVVKEKYVTERGDVWYSVNGHAYAPDAAKNNGLVNFAILKTVRFTEPLASGQEFAEHLGVMAALMGGGRPLMQRVGDFRMGKRSKVATFNGDLYDFEPSLRDCCPSDISLAMPSKILRYIWSGMKKLDTIIPGILHPSTIMYYPEIKLYANKPEYKDQHFQVAPGVFFAGDGAGTSRGITGAWASGIRASEGMMETLQ